MKKNKSLIITFLLTMFLNTFYIKPADENKTFVISPIKEKFKKFKYDDLPPEIWDILGRQVYETKEDAINDGMSFDKYNVFERKEIVIARYNKNDPYVYAIVLGPVEVPEKVKEFKVGYNIGWVVQGINPQCDAFGANSIGKITKPISFKSCEDARKSKFDSALPSEQESLPDVAAENDNLENV